jgi:endonuclease/exonuclease/phosphatase family metal-dependent hydrolase
MSRPGHLRPGHFFHDECLPFGTRLRVLHLEEMIDLPADADPASTRRGGASIGRSGLIRILTYNVHRCLGTDRRLSPVRIADVIAFFEPTIVALQELDVRRIRTGGIDQADVIAQRLGMAFHFHPALRVVEELYGDAILTALPCKLVRAGPLPALSTGRRLEPRGAIWASIDVGGTELQVINTHLGLVARERVAQVETLLGPEWLGHPACREPRILLGDFNAVPRSRAYQRLARRLTDAQRTPGTRRPQATFPARLPLLRIDHAFIGDGIEVLDSTVPRTPLTRVASDHLPLVLDLKITAASACRSGSVAKPVVR